MKKAIDIPAEQIAEFCRRWNVTEFAFFGSVLRDDFRPDSDLDVLLNFNSDARYSLFDLVDMQDELETILHRKVDLTTKRGIEASHNPIRKMAILESAEVIYAA